MSDFLAGRTDVSLRHVCAEGPLLAGIRGTPQRREHAKSVRDRPRSFGHAHARDPRPRGAAAVAAVVRRCLSPTPAWKGPGAVCFYQGCYLLSLDGTGYFSSSSIHCDSCLEKVSKQTGEVTYQHQMLAAVIIHPDHREVIPLAPEPIEKQDGSEKNDCERNAAKRLLRRIRQEHPHLKLIVVEDGLASNAPHIRELQELNMHFILGAKPGDHPFLFDEVIGRLRDGSNDDDFLEQRRGLV